MRMSARLPLPYDVIVRESIVGTEVGGMPGSKVIELQRLPVAGEADAAVIVIDVPDDLVCEYDPSATVADITEVQRPER